MNKKVAIIGASGFIGTNIANYFMSMEYKVLAIARKTNKTNFKIGDIEFCELDANFTTKLFDKIAEYDKLIWLVNNLVPSTKMDSLIDDFTFNISPLIKFLEYVKEKDIKIKLVYLSSGGTIYGNSKKNTLLSETDDQNPISSYGLTKLISEKYISFLVNNSNIDCTLLRPSNIYGEYQNLNKPQGIIGFAFKSLISEESMELYNNGDIVRDFLYVEDLAIAVYQCLENSNFSNTVKIYNVGSGEGIKIIELVEKIEEITGKKLQLLTKPSRNFDCDYNVLNINKIRKEINWIPNTPIDKGLQIVWNYMKNKEY